MRYTVYLLVFFSVLIISACVSRKKYERQMELASNYQDRYNSLVHDSLLLTQRVDSLIKDSIDTHKRLEEVSKKNNVPNTDVPLKYYKPATITKERELKLKVIYLYNIASGIEWDAKYKKDKFVIGVLGNPSFAAALLKDLANKKKGLQDFSIVQFEKVADVTNCHMLFVSKGYYKYMSTIKTKVKEYPTVLVSEEDYKSQGGHFNLAIDGDALKMNANKDLLKKNGFNVSKALLNDAD
jgi:hypothetical protein